MQLSFQTSADKRGNCEWDLVLLCVAQDNKKGTPQIKINDVL